MSLKDFEVIKPLGKGAFASVFQVKRKEDGNIYAMKKVNIATMSSKERDNALNEVRILASVQHNNIIGYKESFYDETTKTLNIIMDFADEGDLDGKLKKHIQSRTNFPENEIWSFLIQILQGLRALHNAKIMHRDLKSANIFLKQGIIKLGDLNVSKIIKKLGMDHTQTGTPYYASPEVWSDKPYDYKCDIWSIGCIIYELCALKPPFRANSLEDLFKAITRGKYDPIPSFYSRELHMMIGILLQVNPKLRPDVTQLLNNPLILKKMDYSKHVDEDTSDGTHLLKTIKAPKNLREINQQLPKQKNYDIGEVILERKNSEENLRKDIQKNPGLSNPYSKIGMENKLNVQPQYIIGGSVPVKNHSNVNPNHHNHNPYANINNPSVINSQEKRDLLLNKKPSDKLNPEVRSINNPNQGYNPSYVNPNHHVQDPYAKISNNRPNPTSIGGHGPRPVSGIGAVPNKHEVSNINKIQDQRAELLKKYNNPISNNNPYSNIQKDRGQDLRIRPRTPDALPKNNVIMKNNNYNPKIGGGIGVKPGINPSQVIGNKAPLNPSSLKKR